MSDDEDVSELVGEFFEPVEISDDEFWALRGARTYRFAVVEPKTEYL